MPTIATATPWTTAVPASCRRAATVLITAFALLAMQAFFAPAIAQTVCGDRAQIISELARVNDETPQAIGLSASGTLIELLVSETGDWTLLVTYPTRETCLLATGESWEAVPVVAANRPAA